MRKRDPVGEADDDLVLTTVGTGMQHRRTEAAGELAHRGDQFVGPPQELGLPPGRDRAGDRHRHRMRREPRQLTGVERAGKR